MHPDKPSEAIELPDAVDAVLTRPIKSSRRRRLETGLRWAMRILLATVFLAAGLLKVKDPIRFAEDIRNYQLMADPVPAGLALSLPWLEILAALGILTGLLYRGSLVLLAGMTLVFMVAITTAWARGLDISCGCFGERSGNATNYPLHLFENGVLLALAGVLLLYQWRQDERTS
ncbi:MAG: putative membrane protein YphA, DoxX/SURF4 family [Verrucomicrobia bacterium]|jgi:uncharacterized membrane protein YphA (DoxX/SURF4 family)|nr:MAG: putative membrane protein YphA, DoxX/SURF4 family [Verrucomicrobiota bacterium]